MHDAVTLANWLSTLHMAEDKDIEKVFEEYRAERYPIAMEALKSSQMFTYHLGKILIGHIHLIMLTLT